MTPHTSKRVTTFHDSLLVKAEKILSFWIEDMSRKEVIEDMSRKEVIYW